MFTYFSQIAAHAFNFFCQTVVYVVVIFGIWNIPVARTLINPLKLFTIGWHEFCHIVAVGLFAAWPHVCCLIDVI